MYTINASANSYSSLYTELVPDETLVAGMRSRVFTQVS
jgi:hypothetical protein